MPFEIEFSAAFERDLELVFDHLFDSYRGFGESVDDSLSHAAKRIVGIRKATRRLSSLPVRGTLRDDVLPGVSYLPIVRRQNGRPT